MFSIFKKEKFPVKTFIFISIFNFLLLVFIVSIFRLVFAPVIPQENQTIKNNDYYLNDNYNEGDPLMTTIPKLRDMITGPIISDNDPSIGPKNSEVVIAQFSDFECSYCKNQEQVIMNVLEDYSDKVRLVWKDFPDIQVDSPSYQASIAGRCAFEQGKFWEYHDLLFKENSFTNDIFMKLADKTNLRIKTFEECLDDDEIKKSIDDNILEADALEINGVPFIYVNDKEVMGEISEEELRKIIDEEINK